jgi:hypothetical protein
MPNFPIALGGQIIFISPGVFNDAGGFEIVRDLDGTVHVVPVPPWDGVDAASALNAVVSTLNLAAVTEKPGLAAKLQNIAQTITDSYSAEITHWAQKAPTQAAEGAAGA